MSTPPEPAQVTIDGGPYRAATFALPRRRRVTRRWLLALFPLALAARIHHVGARERAPDTPPSPARIHARSPRPLTGATQVIVRDGKALVVTRDGRLLRLGDATQDVEGNLVSRARVYLARGTRRVRPQGGRFLVVTTGGAVHESSDYNLDRDPHEVPGLANVEDVAVTDVPERYWHLPAFARTSDGAVYAWGIDDSPEAWRVPGLSRIVELHGSSGSACGRTEDGSLWCWDAFNSLRENPARNTLDTNPGRVAGGDRFAGLALCHDRLCAWTSEGDLRCQEGYPPVVKIIPVRDVVDAALSEKMACARRRGGAVSCWGHGSVAGVTLDARPREVAALRDAVEIALDRSSSSDELNGFTPSLGCARWADGTVRCWGSDEEGALATGAVLARSSAADVRGLRDAVAVAAGERHACALLRDGAVACWGANDLGQLGDGTRLQRGEARVVPGLGDVTELVAGGGHTCARLRSDGRVLCWGDNEAGEVGAGDEEPVHPRPTVVEGLSGVLELSAGRHHTCARGARGEVQCWGRFGGGWPGAPRVYGARRPFPVSLPASVIAIRSTYSAACAMESDRAIWCWGMTGEDIAPVDDPHARRMELDRFEGLSTGTGMNFYAWRRDGYVRYFTVSTGQAVEVGEFGFLRGVTEIVSANDFDCARMRDGTVTCWGQGDDGPRSWLRPTARALVRGLTDATDLAAGYDFACALRRGGAVACWGDNHQGQLGDGRAVMRDTPAVVME